MNPKREYKRLWYIRNKESELAKAKTYRDKKPNYKQNWLKNNGHKPKVRFDKAKSNIVTKKKKEWNITFEQYETIINNNCNYCNESIKEETGSGLDRLDNNKGYTFENVVPCCGDCNKSKNNIFTPEEWKVAIMAIKEFRKNKGA